MLAGLRNSRSGRPHVVRTKEECGCTPWCGCRPVLSWQANENTPPRTYRCVADSSPVSQQQHATDTPPALGSYRVAFELDRVSDLAEFLVADLAVILLPDLILLPHAPNSVCPPARLPTRLPARRLLVRWPTSEASNLATWRAPLVARRLVCPRG